MRNGDSANSTSDFRPGSITIAAAANGWIVNVNNSPFLEGICRKDSSFVFNDTAEMMCALPAIISGKEGVARLSYEVTEHGDIKEAWQLSATARFSPPSSASAEPKPSAATGELPSVEPNRH